MYRKEIVVHLGDQDAALLDLDLASDSARRDHRPDRAVHCRTPVYYTSPTKVGGKSDSHVGSDLVVKLRDRVLRTM